MTKRFLTVVALLTGLAIGFSGGMAGISQAQAESDHKRRKDAWLEELNLSPEQQEQLKQIREKNKEGIKKQKQAMKAERRKLQEAFQSDASDATIKAQFNKVQDQRRAFGEARFDQVLEIRKILTPEQRKKFRAMRGGWHHRHRDKKK